MDTPKHHLRSVSKERRRELRRRILERTRAGLAMGRLPLGYRLENGPTGKVAVVDRERDQFIAEAFCLASEEDKSLSEILKRVTTRGLTGERGQPLTRSSLRRMLTNPFYTGVVYYDGACYPGRHQPIIPPSLFDIVQRRFRPDLADEAVSGRRPS